MCYLVIAILCIVLILMGITQGLREGLRDTEIRKLRNELEAYRQIRGEDDVKGRGSGGKTSQE